MEDMGDKVSHCSMTQASMAFPVLALYTGVLRDMGAVAMIIPQVSFTPQQQFRNVPIGIDYFLDELKVDSENIKTVLWEWSELLERCQRGVENCRGARH